MTRLRIILFGVSLILLTGTSSAQGVEAFVGYSLLNADRGVAGRETDQGWMANYSANVFENVGFVGDFGGQYQDGVDVHQFMGGVRLINHEHRIMPFVEGLVGVIHVDGPAPANTFFAMGLGGGLDYRVHDHLAIRAIQVDWLPYQEGDDWETSYIRMGFGVTIIVP